MTGNIILAVNPEIQLVVDILNHPRIPDLTKETIMRVIRMNSSSNGTTVTDNQVKWFKRLLKDYEQGKQTTNVRESV